METTEIKNEIDKSVDFSKFYNKEQFAKEQDSKEKTYHNLSIINIWCDMDREHHLNMLTTLPSGIEVVSIHTVPTQDVLYFKAPKLENLKIQKLQNGSIIKTADWIYYKEKDDILGEFNFRDPQNEAINLCTNGWILKIDCDEEITLSQANLDLLSNRLQNKILNNIGGFFLPITNAMVIEDLPNPEYITYSNNLRLFRKHKDIKYERMVHEEVGESLNKLNLNVSHMAIPIFHVGYIADENNDNMKFKALRNYLLIIREIEEQPELAFNNGVMQYLYKHLDDMVRFGQIKLMHNNPNVRYKQSLENKIGK